MKNILLYFLLAFGVTNLNSQTIVNAPSINKYANVVAIDYCTNTLSVPPSMGNQFSLGDKILIIQMKGASLIDGNINESGEVEDYNNAGNYEINEIIAINSSATDDVTFKYAIERAYNISGALQLVNIPQYDDVIFQNPLSCLNWNGSFGGVLAFNATGNVTLNANINVSSKGFRGAQAEDNSGINCFGGFGYSGYNCDYALECGAPKGEGIGFRYENKDLARTPNANGGGGGNDHNAGGGGGSAYGIGGRGGDLTEAACNGFGAFGGDILNYNNTINKLFMTGAGGAGDAGNADGTVGATSGGNAGAMVFINAGSITSNGNRIISNGENIILESEADGAGGGGAGGAIILEVSAFNDILTVEANGGKGGDVHDPDRCPGPGGGGSAGFIWLSQSTSPSNLNLIAIGGDAGTLTSNTGPCTGETNDAESGSNGGFYYDFQNFVSNEVFEQLTLSAGNDTIICGDGSASLWANASASNDFDFFWTWNGGLETDYNFDFNPDSPGNYDVIATASYITQGQVCDEVFIVNVDIRNPNISINSSSFFGDTIPIGEVFFINAFVSPLNSNYTYSWTPTDKVDPNDNRNAVATPYESEEFCITVTDELGCTKIECIDLFVYDPKLEAANAFSPNNDNLNDNFIPLMTDDLIVKSFRIYDRWGGIVYDTNENMPWDGNLNGKPQAQDLYLWHIKVEQKLSGKVFEKMGEVSIIR